MATPSARDALILGRYRAVEVVGRGSFGRVLRVIDTATGDARALKVVADGEAMLLDEYELLTRLRHPSLPRVFDVGRTTDAIDDIAAGAPFFIAEWIDGGRCDDQTWDRDRGTRLWSLCADVAGALATIHAAGLVHGDVAPQNVLFARDDARAVLVDLGFATRTGMRGTPAYMAPEALTSQVDPRSDLYGLGATMARLALGRPPFEAASLGELVHRVVTQSPPAVTDVPPPLADLIRRLMARDPDDRPASAIAVLDELDQLAPAIAPGSAKRARPKVGAPPAVASWPPAAPVVDAIARELGGTAPVIAVAGVAATGAHQLVDMAIRRWQLAEVAARRASVPVIAGSLDDIASALGVAAGDGDASRRWLEHVARAARTAGAIVVIDLHDDPRSEVMIVALTRAPAADVSADLAFGRRPVIALCDRPIARPGVASHVAPTLDVTGVATVARQMLGSEPPRAWTLALHAASGGLPLTVVELLHSIAGERDPFAVDWAARTSVGAADRRTRQLAAVSGGARRAAAAIAVWGGRARVDRVLATVREAPAHDLEAAPAAVSRKSVPKVVRDGAKISLAEVVELERAGLARRVGDVVTIDRATGDAAVTAIGHADAASLALAGLGVADRIAPGIDRNAASRARGARTEAISLDSLASLLEHAPIEMMVAARACDVADRLIASGRADRGAALARRALGAAPARAGLIAARAAAASGAYRDVDALARAAERAGADPIETRLVIARAAQRAGDLDAAEATLATLHDAHPDHAEVAGTYARLLVTRSRFADARAIAAAGDAPLAGLRAEAAGLAALYVGDLDDADRAFAALELGASAAGDAASVGRALSLRGMVAQQRGQLGLASDRYRDAARRLHEVGEVHAAATAELNLGTVLAERGRASEALPRLAAAGRVFAELGATTELVAADLNRGNALISVGQLDDARAAADAALAHADGAPHLRAFALLVAGEARRRGGDDRGAERYFRDGLATAVERGDAHAQVSAWVCLADAGRRDVLDVDVEALCASADDRDRWTVARGRLRLRLGDDHDGESALSLARACAAAAARADEADRLDYAFRGHAVASQLASRGPDAALARSEADRARTAHAAMVAATAPAFRAAVEADPDVALIAAEPARAPRRDAADRPREGNAGHLRRLLTLSRRLNTETSVDRILDEVIDTAIELTAAERGFLLLRGTTGELAPVVSRNFIAGDLDAGPSVSRSIAERAAQTGEPVVTVDAGVDERFGTSASVAALRLRSVLAVPLRQRGAITGCIYVDHRLRGGAFDDAAATVLGELADIAAIAIENARLTDDLRRTTREVDELNGRLSAELAERDAELVRVKADLPDRDRLRAGYDHIVGRSPVMLRMLDIIDRAAATSLPVVVIGESGTGKELVARALHDHGPRKAGPFVAINCSAVPEPLLESELFGHVRGAFTGADRDRRGLFEVADGGTLFLDEVADTSAAMQAKLLRVLQDGMIRRVGDTRTRSVDVRIITASRHSLAELAATGGFRDDLRYRLEVISVPVPPLRDRDGDLPLLVEALLARIAGAKTPPRLTRAAVRALGQHRWPGNVRELENALARGVAMGGDVIDTDDLPESVAAAAGRPEPTKPTVHDDLRLKPALTATEQAYITAAMSRAKNNQTVAARLLGLSRFGLQKKLRRLSGESDDD